MSSLTESGENNNSEHGRDLLVALLQMQAAFLAVTVALSIVLFESLGTRRTLAFGYTSLIAQTTRGLNFTAGVVILLATTILSLVFVPTILAAYVTSGMVLLLLMYLLLIYHRYNDVVTNPDSRSGIAEARILDQFGRSIEERYEYDRANARYHKIGRDIGFREELKLRGLAVRLELDYNDILYRDDNPFREEYLTTRIRHGIPFFRIVALSDGRLLDANIRLIVSLLGELLSDYCNKHDVDMPSDPVLHDACQFELLIAIGHQVRRGQSIASVELPPIDHRSWYRPPPYIMTGLRECLVIRSEADIGQSALALMDTAVQRSLETGDYGEVRVGLRLYVGALANLHRYESAVRRCQEIIPTLHLDPSRSLDRLDAYRDLMTQLTTHLGMLSQRRDEAELDIARELGHFVARTLGETSSSTVVLTLLERIQHDYQFDVKLSPFLGRCPKELAFDVCKAALPSMGTHQGARSVQVGSFTKVLVGELSIRTIARMLEDKDASLVTPYTRDLDDVYRSVLLACQATLAELATTMIASSSHVPMASCMSNMLSAVEPLGDFVEEVRPQFIADTLPSQYAEFTSSIVVFYDELRVSQLSFWLMCIIIAEDRGAPWVVDLSLTCADLLYRHATDRGLRLSSAFPGPTHRDRLGLPSADQLINQERSLVMAWMERAHSSAEEVASCAREAYVLKLKYRFGDDADWWWPLLADTRHRLMHTWRMAVRDRDVSEGIALAVQRLS